MEAAPFRVEFSRRWLVGSLAGHVGITLLFSLLGAAFLSPPPPLQVLRVNLQSVEVSAEQTPTPPIPEVVEERTQPVVEETPDPVPSPPEEVVATVPAPQPDQESGVPEEITPLPDPETPDFELPREARAVPDADDVDFLEPAAVQSGAPDTPPPVAAPDPEEVAVGATVQATAAEGIDDTYLKLVQQKIGRRWRPTDAATRGLREVSCVVSFRIGSQGEVIAPTVTASSGLSVFDRRALAAVERSAPLPPPPARFGSSGLEIDFRFNYAR
jgi:protein TonB